MAPRTCREILDDDGVRIGFETFLLQEVPEIELDDEEGLMKEMIEHIARYEDHDD